MPGNFMEYLILQEAYPEILETKVNRLLRKGYHLRGELIVINNFYIQVLVLNDDVDSSSAGQQTPNVHN